MPLTTGGYDETVRLWDMRSRTLARTFQAHAPVQSVTFGPDGKTLAAGCNDTTARLWKFR